MPSLIYGTAWKKEDTADLVVSAVKTGFRGIDTACQPKHYREDLVGEAIERLAAEGLRREALWVQTKFTPVFGHDPQSVPYNQHAAVAEQVAQSFEVSKKNLRTQFIDCLLLHSPLESHRQNMEVWHAFEQLVQRSEVGHIGISNCYDLRVLRRLHAAATIKPAVVQNRFYKDSQFDWKLRRWCSDHGVAYQGFWTLSANRTTLRAPQLLALARARRRTPEQTFFRFLLDEGIAPLIGTRSELHMHEDLQVLHDDPLSGSAREEIWEMYSMLGTSFESKL